jgi:hypothetical protein
MASGYNQDSNQLTPGLYRVVLTMNPPNYPVITGNTVGGGVWPYDWTNQAYTNVTTLSAAQALTLAQGNVRWESILEGLSLITGCRILNVSVTASSSTDATAQPTAVAFTVEFDRDYFLLGEWTAIQKAAGATASGAYYISQNDGSTVINSSALAIQDIITSAIVRGGASAGYSRSYRVYSPTLNGDSQVKVTVTQPCTPATAFTTVGVTQISGTTLSGTPL